MRRLLPQCSEGTRCFENREWFRIRGVFNRPRKGCARILKGGWSLFRGHIRIRVKFEAIRESGRCEVFV